jgi:NDP-sugar pyrophosphorylase family protein
MATFLICPSARPTPHLATSTPLAAIPLLGECLVEYWLAHLAMTGTREVKILADDRPEQIAAIAGDGARWGLKVDVIAESRELTPSQVQIKYVGAIDASHNVVVVDHFPGMTQRLFDSYTDFFTGLIEWLPRAKMPDRVGVRELSPGIWAGLHSRIAPNAQLLAPCWIGQSAFVGAGAVVGPMTVIEDRAFIEPGAEVAGSVIGPDTFVGQLAIINGALAWGSTLVQWKSGLCTTVAEAFLLCSLRAPAAAHAGDSLFSRLGDLYARNKDDLQMFWKHLLMNKEG